MPPDEGFTSRCLVRDGCGYDPEDVARAASEATRCTMTGRTVWAYGPAAEGYRVMVMLQGRSAAASGIARMVSGGTAVYVRGHRVEIIPFTHEGVDIARTASDNRAAMNVHAAARDARGTAPGGTFSTVVRVTRAGQDGAETGARPAHAFLGPCSSSPWAARAG